MSYWWHLLDWYVGVLFVVFNSLWTLSEIKKLSLTNLSHVIPKSVTYTHVWYNVLITELSDDRYHLSTMFYFFSWFIHPRFRWHHRPPPRWQLLNPREMTLLIPSLLETRGTRGKPIEIRECNSQRVKRFETSRWRRPSRDLGTWKASAIRVASFACREDKMRRLLFWNELGSQLRLLPSPAGL